MFTRLRFLQKLMGQTVTIRKNTGRTMMPQNRLLCKTGMAAIDEL